MKSSALYILTIILGLALIQGCGPEEAEVERDQQAIQDSLEQAYQAELQQMRRDSIEQARADSIAAAEEMARQRNQINYSENGEFIVQIEAWRSEVKAQQQANQWNNRGYDRAFVVRYGNEDTGNIWYRVRIGRFDTRQMAERLQDKLREEHGATSWVSRIGQPVEPEARQGN